LKKNILITSAGRRVSLLKAFQDALKSHLPNSVVFTADLNPLLSPACHLSEHTFLLPHVKEPEYIDHLLQICRSADIGLVVPTLDTELLVFSRAKSIFEKEGIVLLVSDESLISLCSDKRKTVGLFKTLDIETPKQFCKNDIEYPAFAKPFDGSMSKNVWVLPTKEYLPPILVRDENMMFMEYLNPDVYDEYTVDAYYDRSHLLKCLVPRVRLEIRGGEVSKGITKRDEVYDYVLKRIKKIPGARGCLTLQFFKHRKEHRIVGIEINPRFGGGYPLSHKSGVDFPSFLIQEYLMNKKIRFQDSWRANNVMLRYDAEVFFRSGDS